MRFRLVVFLLLPMLIVFVAGVVVYGTRSRPFVIDQYGVEVVTTLELKAAFTTSWLEDRIGLVRAFARAPEVERWDPAALAVAARRFAQSFDEFSAVVYVDAEGISVAESAGAPGGFVGDRPYFRRAIAGEANTSPALTGRNTGRRIVIFAAPVYGDATGADADDGTAGDAAAPAAAPRGIVFGAVRLDSLNAFVGELAPGHDIYTTLYDGAGSVVATNYDPRVFAEGAAHNCVGIEPALYTGPEGRMVLGARRVITDDGWAMVAEAPADRMFRLFQDYNNSLLTTGIIATGLSLLFAFALAASVVRPIARLDTISRDAAAGRYDDALARDFPPTAPRELRHLFGAMVDMIRLVRRRQVELERISVTDSLTSLANRRYLEEEAKRIFVMCARAGKPCTVLVIDVDHFKSVNDRYGHDTGDAVLIGLAVKMRRLLRAGDLLARYGGEEFVAVLPKTSCTEGVVLAERMRGGIEGAVFEAAVHGLHLTVSIGVAPVHIPTEEDPDAFDELLGAGISVADAALYSAKRAGRNRVQSAC